ncbi:integrase core domain-containing protein [Streptomyces shenzhenensis]|uniref:integrase core domain-containing protein n=1 Tax=Streptomyces shenzhenensis TaxID=943815 RepID=UPI00383080DF
MCRHDGHRVSQATVLRLLRDEGLLLEASYRRVRRHLAARRLLRLLVEVRARPARGIHRQPARRDRRDRARPRSGRTPCRCPAGRPRPRDADGAVQPLVAIVTNNGGPFSSFRFEAFIATRPELRHVRAPGRNGSRERGFGCLKYEKLFLEEIPDALDLVRHAEDYGTEYNTARPHEPLAWNRPHDIHTGLAGPLVSNFPGPENLPTT